MYKNTLTHWFSVGTSEAAGVEEKSTKKKNKNQFHVVAQSRNASFVLTIVVHVLKYFISKSTRKVTFFFTIIHIRGAGVSAPMDLR